MARRRRQGKQLPAHHEAYIDWSMVIVMTRRLARTRDPASAQAQPQPI